MPKDSGRSDGNGDEHRAPDRLDRQRVRHRLEPVDAGDLGQVLDQLAADQDQRRRLLQAAIGIDQEPHPLVVGDVAEVEDEGLGWELGEARIVGRRRGGQLADEVGDDAQRILLAQAAEVADRVADRQEHVDPAPQQRRGHMHPGADHRPLCGAVLRDRVGQALAGGGAAAYRAAVEEPLGRADQAVVVEREHEGRRPSAASSGR